jgi:hypothetical protein
MWSHYAGEHSGIRLQFELARDLLVLMRAVTVDFVDEYPAINWIDSNFLGGIGVTFTRKHSRWAYEGERRILVDGQAGRYLRYEPAAYRDHFGCRANQDTRNCIDALLRGRAAAGLPELKRSYARQNEKRYELDIWSQ